MSSLSSEEINKILNESNEIIKNEREKSQSNWDFIKEIATDTAILRKAISKIKKSHKNFNNKMDYLEKEMVLRRNEFDYLKDEFALRRNEIDFLKKEI
jgi:chromosome segregation ATPase